uniref:Uncharacterized protein n=1 Tax=Chromera velia CCMP2878 TaxID=1169474 RepID=A0A0G4I7H4_9ALVE|eukprot:Cvel_11663.t1-p1 / transcript=Cvel_11663.t1 / gene=Cvel_11663 / organism=Chromera_velia_CCMP2878 / gene_product=hypothetical protein / transcript_product=hypothetical protein / location=Cvel_scaffold739:35551-36426(-) / protein_length=292 / sequence_SO=supercontig / SO=protein_coding / is_pseudo=false
MSPDPLSPDALKLSSSSQENGEEDEYDEDAAQFRGGTVDVPKSMVTLKRRTLQRLIREIGLQDNRIGSPDRLFIDKKAGITYRRELAREGGRSPYFEAFKEACRMQPPKVCDMKKYRLDYSQASTLLRSGGRFAQVDMQLVPGEEAREEDLLHLPRAKTEEGQKIGAFLDEFFTGLAWKQRLDTYQSGHTRLCQNLLEECRETITWIASSRPRMCGESHIQKVGCTTGNSFALFQDFDKWDPPIISKHRRKRMKVKETPKEREMRLRKRAKIARQIAVRDALALLKPKKMDI